MAKLIGIVAGLVVFGIWTSIVGNPHVVETVVGLVLAVAVGAWTYQKARKFGGPRP